MKIRIAAILFGLIFLGMGCVSTSEQTGTNGAVADPLNVEPAVTNGPPPSVNIIEEERIENTSERTVVIPQDFVMQNVPFTPQAPFADWADQRQQDGCEEAAVLMAAYWVKGETLTAERALEEILTLSSRSERLFGTFRDSDSEDTAILLLDYFDIESDVRHNATLQQIKEELWEGNIILVPSDGQSLGNPNFTAPGPERHMVVIIGYDAATREFITNDPGTRHGEHYRYNEDVLFNAIRDYPTGDHQPITQHTRSMITVSAVGR